MDTKAINRFADIKGNQVMDAMEAIGRIFGGGKNTGIIISLSAVILPIIGFAIHEEAQKSEQEEKTVFIKRLYSGKMVKLRL